MMNNNLAEHIRFEQVQGVGTVDINFAEDKNAYVLIGENGVGKTKFLESLFATLLITNHQVFDNQCAIQNKCLPFESIQMGGKKLLRNNILNGNVLQKKSFHNLTMQFPTNPYPVIYLSASLRSNLNTSNNNIGKLGSYDTRRKQYFNQVFNCFRNEPNKLKSLNMDTNLEEWIIQRAQSANPYQAKEDNRKIEIDTLLKLLNKIDKRIDGEFLEISGDNRVFIKIENQKRELSQLSSGFTAILKMLQAIIAGYSYFTNETHIQNVRGFVLIDEIESHLHNEWQVKIVPLLKELFPNTTFVITTHSSLVISQVEQGEAYRLQRADDGVVYGKEINNPNKVPFIDLMQTAFDINLNELKINQAEKSQQTQAKKALLAFVEKELSVLDDNVEGNHE